MLSLRSLALVGFWTALCCSSETSDPESFLWFSVTPGQRGELQVYKDNSYEVLVQPKKQGHLDDTTVAELRTKFSDSSIKHYIEGHQSFSEDCRQNGIVITWWQGITACWIQAEVTDASTAEMLAYVIQLHARLGN